MPQTKHTSLNATSRIILWTQRDIFQPQHENRTTESQSVEKSKVFPSLPAYPTVTLELLVIAKTVRMSRGIRPAVHGIYFTR